VGLFDSLFGNKGSESFSDETEFHLNKHLDSDFMVFPMADTKTSVDQLTSIANQYCVKYPSEFKGHVCGKFPGIYIEVKESIWPRPKPYDVGPFWSFLYALHTYTPASTSGDWMRLDFAAESFQRQTRLIAAPILQIVGDGDVYCVNAEGHIFQFKHEQNALCPVNLTFWQLFDRELAELRSRKEKKIALLRATVEN
jgi:hypothetical protein